MDELDAHRNRQDSHSGPFRRHQQRRFAHWRAHKYRRRQGSEEQRCHVQPRHSRKPDSRKRYQLHEIHFRRWKGEDTRNRVPSCNRDQHSRRRFCRRSDESKHSPIERDIYRGGRCHHESKRGPKQRDIHGAADATTKRNAAGGQRECLTSAEIACKHKIREDFCKQPGV